MVDQVRNDQLLSHYRRFFGAPKDIKRYGPAPSGGPTSISVVEFAPEESDDVWTYITLGASNVPMPSSRGHVDMSDGIRGEYMFYSQDREPRIRDVLANLAAQPFLHGRAYGYGDTLPGPPTGLIPDSPLSDLLLAKPFFVDEDFEVVPHEDGTHTHIVWAIPIYPSERIFAVQHGDLRLFDLFIDQEIDSSDLHRPPVV